MAANDTYEIEITTIPQLTTETLGHSNGGVISISAIEANAIDGQSLHRTSVGRSKVQVTATLLALFVCGHFIVFLYTTMLC